MDNNNQIPKAPVINTPTQSQGIVTPQVPNPDSSSDSSKIVLWFTVGLVVIVIVVGGIYLFLSKQQGAAPGSQTVVQTPVPVVQENLENDINNINVEDADSDFASVDQDLQQL